MPQLFSHIISASSVNNHILVDESLAKMCSRIKANLINSSLYVQIVAKYQYKTVLNMGKNIFSLSVDFVVPSPNGSVGEIHISAKVAIKNNVRGNISVNMEKTNYQSAKDQENALLEAIIKETEMKNLQVVLYAETLRSQTRISDMIGG